MPAAAPMSKERDVARAKKILLKKAKEKEKALRKKGKLPPLQTFCHSEVAVTYSGEFSVRAWKHGYLLMAIDGTFEETFLLVLYLIVTRTKRLPFGACPECGKVFGRVRRQRCCSLRCTWARNKRESRIGLAKPRKSRKK